MANVTTITISDLTALYAVTWEQQKMADAIDPMQLINSGIFEKIDFPYNSGDTRRYTSMQLEQYAKRKTEGADAKIAKFQQGYTKDLTITRVAVDLPISWEARNMGKYDEIMQIFKNLSGLVSNRIDLDLAHRFTFASATTYTNIDGETVDISVGDTLALLSTVHTLKASTTTYRNRVATDPQLSMAGIEAAQKLFTEETYDHFGVKLTEYPDAILTTDDPNTCNTMARINNSSSDLSYANSGVINVNKARWKHIKSARIATTATGAPDTTKAKYWFMMALKHSTAKLAIMEPASMKTPSSEAEKSNDDITYGARGTFGVCIVTPEWVKGSLATA